MHIALSDAQALVTAFRRNYDLPADLAFSHVDQSLFPLAVVPIDEVEPFERAPGLPGIVAARANAILLEIFEKKPLYPVNVYEQTASLAARRFKLYHGFHRYYISLAIGFSHIPVAINPTGTENAL
ncbi:hypothetical protein [Piscinibacter gummiphilus]|uniref:hypothetical protein n=1 Tax=Piscinibacter gummiphilus TaxID=946333 RepID=UPI0012F4A4BD|nr:hypothetical protein [Piscinibacter gummiphilus]GLS93876.1 hypothetical protein GCM10007918_11680 [Piscinibacter gummiphilus]